MTARVQERIKRELRNALAEWGIDMAKYDRGFIDETEGFESVTVSFKMLETKPGTLPKELTCDDVYFDEETGEILEWTPGLG